MEQNIIIITLDALRKDRVGAYGNPNNLTPTLDRLTKNGWVFNNCFTVSNTSAPSHTSLLSGCYPTTHGVRTNGWKIPEQAVLISEILKKHGYSTVGSVSQEMLGSVYNFNKGFDKFYDNSRLDKIMSHLSKIGTPRYNVRKILQYFKIVKSHSRPGKKALKDAATWLDDNHKSKFFMFLHLFDIHRNSFAEENDDIDLSKPEIYDKNVKLVDNLVEQLVEHLTKLGVKDNTWIALMADHGECLGERGKKSHGHTLLDIEFRVPLVIHHPSLKHKRIEETCRTIDVVPTILDLVNITPKVKLDGQSMKQANREAIKEIYMEGCQTFLDIKGIRTNQWKYTIEKNSIEELYDMLKDPEEKADVKEQNKEITKRLREKVKAHFAKGNKGQETDEHTKEMLRKLGYLD